MDKEVIKSKALFERLRRGDRGKWASQCIEDRAFKMSAQWSAADAASLHARNQAALPINELIPTINLVISQLTENSPRFTAVGVEISDNALAGKIADLMQHIWRKSKSDGKLKRAIIDYEDIGMGALIIYVDPFADWGKGEIMIDQIDPLELYIDPSSVEPDSSDATDIMIVKRLTKERIENLYPDFIFDSNVVPTPDSDYPIHNRYTGEDQVLKAMDDEFDKYMVMDRYTKIKQIRYHLYDRNGEYEDILNKEEYDEYLQKPAVIVTKLNTPDQVRIDDRGVEELIALYQETGGIFHLMVNETGQVQKMNGAEHNAPNVIKGSTTQLSVVTIGQLINEGFISVNKIPVNRIKRVIIIGEKLYRSIPMDIENHPIITFMLHHNRNPFPLGDIRLVKPLQEQVNKLDSLILAYMANIANIKLLVPRGTNTKEIKDEWGKSGTAVIEVDMEIGAPIVVQLTQMSTALYNHRQVLIAQIQRIIGAYSFQDGEATQAPRTKGGTILMDEMMQRRTRSKKFDIEQGLDQLGRVVSDLIPTVYTERKIIRITEPNHKPVETIFNETQKNQYGEDEIINDLTVGKYDIRIVSNSMAPTNKMVRREELTNLFTSGIIKDPTPIIRELDLPNVDEMLETESALNQAGQYIQQLEEKLKEATGDLQTANREVIQSGQKVEIEKFKTRLKRIETELDGSKVKAQLEMALKVKEKKQPTK